MRLPSDFTDRMRLELGCEFESFLTVYENEPFYGARANTLKISADELKKLTGFCKNSVPWCKDGFYYEGKKGSHPAFAAGLFYSQEPSAMAAAEMLPVKKGDRVLDLCAAPGGKSTQLASKMEGEGVLVLNEISPKRVKVLCENVVRCGIRNAVVTNMRPDALQKHFEGFFDKILVDAPCSGEGMFRKDGQAAEEWSLEHTYACAQRQLNILKSAFYMLRPGGLLVYSTCTFSREENEDVCEKIISMYKDVSLEKSIRLMPHKVDGEGHFAALFRKSGKGERLIRKKGKEADKSLSKVYRDFERENLNIYLDGEITSFGSNLYIMPYDIGSLEGIKCSLAGIRLGEVRKGRLIPAHHMCMCLKKDDFKRSTALSDEEISLYLRGESLFCEAEKGFGAVLYADKYPLGWYKCSLSQLKNYYPKNLRGEYYV